MVCTHLVHGLKEKPVVGDHHCSPQRSSERTEVGNVICY